ncbi:Crp/Fnr family transcriptional regulator [Virgibacillus chiguensis]|uniref:CRP/FNR family transcriptional regulator, anaerobic regulatory protein n=1 Tax=Virgibacillus chiguensis TaxID=411959 RepID=A0A1M5MCQ1_9BACI|nr:Crp/Fnr family transcriptional regulator [Virgibacillus chiguensis]SHG75090.1 CRP/FNR family transcriptional regulator, anaerobic regulatory protein [Virgibacillus chiguensis]
MRKLNYYSPSSQEKLTVLQKYANIEKDLEKNETLFISGDIVHSFYIVLLGKIMLHKPTADGREFTIRICKQGDIIGEPHFLTTPTKHLLHATAVERSKIFTISIEKLPELFSNESKFMLYLLQNVSKNAIRDQMKLRDLVMYGKKGALYATLIRLANSYGQTKETGILINTSLTNQDLANFCGTSRESINRLLSDLRKNNIISIENSRILIHQLAYLKETIHCEECPIDICTIH